VDEGGGQALRTEVRKFGYVKATSLDQAVSFLTKFGGPGRIVNGGTDVLSQIKNNIAALIPNYVVDISGLDLNYIRSDASGLRIGGTTHISDVQLNPIINQNYAVLAQAALNVATPQIRNAGTVAGDLLQEVWCWYLRYNYTCWRSGGDMCYGAIGDNRVYHSIFGGRLCYAVHAGDLAEALFALDADVTVFGPGGQRTMDMDELIPGINTVDGRVKENVLHYNEILTEVHIPTPSPGTRSAYYKIRPRKTWDFALASAAVKAKLDGGTVAEPRIVLGGVDVKPHRATSAEQFLAGQQLNESSIAQAAEKALDGATPLTFGTGNAYKVELAKGAVKKALRLLLA
jgi:xanthine dehydrogenase YagS FAD-binding subunit